MWHGVGGLACLLYLFLCLFVLDVLSFEKENPYYPSTNNSQGLAKLRTGAAELSSGPHLGDKNPLHLRVLIDRKLGGEWKSRASDCILISDAKVSTAANMPWNLQF